MKACPVCNKPFKYNRYSVHLLDDPLPHMRFVDNHLLCKKKLIQFEQSKLQLRKFFKHHDVIVNGI